MTKKEKLTLLAQKKAEKQAIEDEIEKIQWELLEDWDGNYDLDGIKVSEQRVAKYYFREDLEKDFEEKYPDQVKKSYVTKWLGDKEKQMYFEKKRSSPFLKFEGL